MFCPINTHSLSSDTKHFAVAGVRRLWRPQWLATVRRTFHSTALSDFWACGRKWSQHATVTQVGLHTCCLCVSIYFNIYEDCSELRLRNCRRTVIDSEHNISIYAHVCICGFNARAINVPISSTLNAYTKPITMATEQIEPLFSNARTRNHISHN